MKTAVILSGGLGTRLRPLTLEMPKALIPVQGKSLTEQVIDKVKESGVKTVYLSIGYMSDKIEEYFDKLDLGVKINYIVESEPLGTGGWMHKISLQQIEDDFSEDFIVVNGDNLFDLDWSEMMKVHSKNKSNVTIALTTVDDVSAYGVAALKGEMIVRFVEKPIASEAPSNFINSGYYIFSPSIFDILPEKEKFSLEKEFFPIIAANKKLFGYKDEVSQWFDTGTFSRWERVINEWKNKLD